MRKMRVASYRKAGHYEVWKKRISARLCFGPALQGEAMSLIVFCSLVAVAALSGAFFKPGEWYDRLKKPDWNPPKWVFPVVWTVLYAFIAIAGWLIWQEAGTGLVLAIWGLQLILNAAWSYFFFGIRRMDWAFWDVTGLVIAVLAFIIAAWPISMWAALLFLPYLAWVGTAALLNWTVWKLNPNVT